MNTPKPFGMNYVESEQNSEEWLNERKFKITGSRLPALLGFYGRNIFFEVKIHPLLYLRSSLLCGS